MTVQPKRKQRFLFPKRLLSLLIMALLVGCIVLMGLRLFLLRGWSSLPKPSMKYVPSLLEQAPCLAGVCVGMVGREAVFEALSQSDLISGIRDNGGSTIGFYINGRLPMGVIFAQDEHGQYEVVERFNLQAPGISLEMILSALGEPDNLFLMFGCGNGVYIHAKLLYREEGIEVQLQYPVGMRERNESVVFNNDMPSAWTWYFDPARYDEWLFVMMEDLLSSTYFDMAPTITPESLVAVVQPWPGMGVPVQPLDLCPRH